MSKKKKIERTNTKWTQNDKSSPDNWSTVWNRFESLDIVEYHKVWRHHKVPECHSSLLQRVFLYFFELWMGLAWKFISVAGHCTLDTVHWTLWTMNSKYFILRYNQTVIHQILFSITYNTKFICVFLRCSSIAIIYTEYTLYFRIWIILPNNKFDNSFFLFHHFHINFSI